MNYVWACYIAVFGILTIYAARLVLRSRQIAAKVLAAHRDDQT
jgi:hypothetical protein